MYRKSADHLKVAWYIIRLKKIWSTKVPGGGGGGSGGLKYTNLRMYSMLISYGIQNVIERLTPVTTPLHPGDVLNISLN